MFEKIEKKNLGVPKKIWRSNFFGKFEKKLENKSGGTKKNLGVTKCCVKFEKNAGKKSGGTKKNLGVTICDDDFQKDFRQFSFSKRFPAISFVMILIFKKISSNLIYDDFICDDKQTDRQTDKQTDKQNSIANVVKSITTRAEWQLR